MVDFSVLVTGGAGYIGSHAALRLLKDSFRVTIVVYMPLQLSIIVSSSNPAPLVTYPDSYDAYNANFGHPTIQDNLSRGNIGAIKVLQNLFPEPGRLQFIQADLGDPKAVS